MIKRNQKYFNWINRLSDLAILYAAYAAAVWFWLYYKKQDAGNIAAYYAFVNPLPLLALLFAFIVVFQYGGMYDSFRFRTLLSECVQLFKVYLPCTAFAAACVFLLRLRDFSRGVLISFAVLAYILLCLKRAFLRWFLRGMRRRGYNQKHVLVVGCGYLAEKYAESVRENPQYGYNIIGYVGDAANETLGYCLGRYDELAQVIDRTIPDETVIALQENEIEMMNDVIMTCEEQGVRANIIPIYNDYLPDCATVDVLGRVKLINIRATLQDVSFNRGVKRAADIVISALVLIILSPLLLIIALGVKLSSPGPVLFRQVRVGRGRKKFTMYKFRSMVMNDSADTAWSTERDERVTPFGAFIRKLSLDELPQFFNVLKGDMSVIGPRPELPYFVQRYKYEIPRYMVKHQVKPGITGWAQVHGLRGDTSIKKRIEYDIWYIENWSIFLDVKILFMTVFGGMVNSEKNLEKEEQTV